MAVTVEEILGKAAPAHASRAAPSPTDLSILGRAKLLRRVLEIVDSESVKLAASKAPSHTVLATPAYAELYHEIAEHALAAMASKSDTLIIGGGLSGILVALVLSQRTLSEAESVLKADGCDTKGLHKICLLEAKGNLGGRLTFGWQTENEKLSRVLGGFSIDLFGTGMCQIANQLIAVLDSFEKEFLLDWILQLQDSLADEEKFVPLGENKPVVGSGTPATAALASEAASRAFVVRKELTSVTKLLAGPSECLSRAASGALAEFLSLKEESLQGRLGETEFWKLLKKNCREELEPFFKTLVGDEFQNADCLVLRASLEIMFGFQIPEEQGYAELGQAELALKRALVSCPMGLLCLGIEWILRSRGVRVLLNSRVSSIHVSPNSHGKVSPPPRLNQRLGASARGLAGNDKSAQVTGERVAETEGVRSSAPAKYECVLLSTLLPFGRLAADRLVVAVPLAQALGVVPRELFSPSESRFVMKTRPRSLVALEIDEPARAPEYKRLEGLALGGKLFFPIERVLGVKTSADKLILFSWIDYEISLQAPGVREVLGRLKRAFRRVFNQTDLETFSRYSAKVNPREKIAREHGNSEDAMAELVVQKRDLGERLLLISVAQSVPADASNQPAVSAFFDDVGGASQHFGAGAGNLRTFWFAGEQYENSRDAWKSMANSAMAIVNEITAHAKEPGSQEKSANEAISEPLRRQPTKKGVHDAVLEKS